MWMGVVWVWVCARVRRRGPCCKYGRGRSAVAAMRCGYRYLRLRSLRLLNWVRRGVRSEMQQNSALEICVAGAALDRDWGQARQREYVSMVVTGRALEALRVSPNERERGRQGRLWGTQSVVTCQRGSGRGIEGLDVKATVATVFSRIRSNKSTTCERGDGARAAAPSGEQRGFIDKFNSTKCQVP